MADKPPDNETLERVLKTEPEKLLSRLPDNTESRSARRHLDFVYKYAVEARESVKTPNPPEP